MSRSRGRIAALLLAVSATILAACSETLDGGAGCPSLCPTRTESFRDTTFEAVVLDTSIGGFPVNGLAPYTLLANRPDTLVTRMVVRFDALTQTFAPNKTGITEDISTVDSVYVVLPVDTTGSRASGPLTIEAFDVDTSASDTVAAVVASLFRADRKLGAMTVTTSAITDTLRFALDKQKVAAKIVGGFPLRVGFRIASGTGQMRFVAFASGAGAPRVSYDPNTDTTYAPIIVGANTTIQLAAAETELAYTVYSLVDVGSPAPGSNTLTVGGFPAYRSYLRFAVPARISDSSTIVRADLLLTQRRSRFGNANDSVAIYPLVPTATTDVTDLRRVLDLSADGFFAAVDSTRLVPSDSGVRAVNVLTLVRSWPALPTGVPRALAFRIGLEGAQPAELRFFSSEAAAGLRPRLRITYLPKSEFAIP
ncbi:MAG: hypothetical protein LCH84_09965 [Gemmatimonadetes bacterium]|nr:hypothetical protein [Gemmatimonadota bacterium]